MPFPWKKKTRVTRISRIVADLHTPKRGASLLLHTGFPTSLIDLFVKNRTRFSSPNPKSHTRPHPRPPPPSPASTPPPNLPLSPILSAEPPLTGENYANADVSSSDRVRECEEPGSDNRVGVAVRIIIAMVVSIASAKTLTVGITVSAFALLLLECAAKRCVSCSNVVAESLARRALCACGLFQKPSKPNKTESIPLLGEIEVVEVNKEESFCLFEPELLEEEEVDNGKVVFSECRSSSSSSSCRRSSFSFNSKMVKKLLPKKFRGGSKKVKVKESEVSMSFENKKCETECLSYDDDCGMNGSCEEQESLLLVREREEVRRIGRVGNSGYRILVLIALAGLVVGRSQALLLIMAWCFMLKILQTLP